MPLFSSVISWFIKQRIHQIELFVKYPNEVQDELLKRLVINARYTEFGRRFDFSSIASTQEDRKSVV